MKILFYNHTGKVSGAERVLLMILAGLERGQFDPVVACPEDGRLKELVQDLRVPTVRLRNLEARFTWRPNLLLRYLISFVRVILAARAQVINQAPDVIHANSIRAGLVMSASTIGLDVPVIWHVHDMLPRHPFSTAIRFFVCASRRNHILVVSQAVADGFRGVLLRSLPKLVPVTVIHNAVDLVRFHPGLRQRQRIRCALDLGDTQPVVGIVGQLTPRKGQLELIEAFAEVGRQLPTAVLLIVGEPLFNRDEQYAQSLRDAAKSCGFGDRVRFLGPRDDVSALMQALDVLVVNSHAEPFALTVLEGLASGISVLATAVGGTKEMIRHNENGWLVSARNEKALADAMLRLLTDAKLREHLGKAGRREAVARFSTERFLGEIRSLYRGVVRCDEAPRRRCAESLKAELSAD